MNMISPLIGVLSARPLGSRASAPSPPCGFLSMTSYSWCAAVFALITASMDEPAMPKEKPPMSTAKNTMITVPPVMHGELPALRPVEVRSPLRYPHPQFGFVSRVSVSMIE